MSKYHYFDGNEQKGPYGIDQLKSFGLKPDTLVWREGFDDWKPAKNVGELQFVLMSSPTVKVETDKTSQALASLILGISGLFAWIIPIFGFPVTIIGLIMGIKGQKSSKKGMATAGVIMSIIGLVASIINSAIGAYKGSTGSLF